MVQANSDSKDKLWLTKNSLIIVEITMSILTRVVLTGAILSLAACASTPNPMADMTTCKKPRPQVCTMQYDPVCAKHADGSLKTHATDCTACGKADVIGYIKGACPE